MLLDCLEYSPAVIAVALIAREPERDKQRFDGFRSFFSFDKYKKKRKTVREEERDVPEHVSSIVRWMFSDAVKVGKQKRLKDSIPSHTVRP
jgi:hypothetical protein